MPKETFYNLSEDKKQRIVDAAIQKVGEKGYDKTSISAIIKVAGIPRGSFYQYFEDKLDLFMYIFETIQHKKLAYFKPLMQEIEQKPFIVLYRQFIEYGLRFSRENPDAFMLGYQIYKSNDLSLNRILNHLEEAGIASLIDYVKKDVEKGFVKEDVDVKTVATLLYNFNARDILEALYQGKGDEEILAMSDKILTILKYGILKGD